MYVSGEYWIQRGRSCCFDCCLLYVDHLLN
jgi:hypothetical protein